MPVILPRHRSNSATPMTNHMTLLRAREHSRRSSSRSRQAPPVLVRPPRHRPRHRVRRCCLHNANSGTTPRIRARGRWGAQGPEIFAKFIELAGGPDALIVEVPTAGGDSVDMATVGAVSRGRRAKTLSPTTPSVALWPTPTHSWQKLRVRAASGLAAAVISVSSIPTRAQSRNARFRPRSIGVVLLADHPPAPPFWRVISYAARRPTTIVS